MELQILKLMEVETKSQNWQNKTGHHENVLTLLKFIILLLLLVLLLLLIIIKIGFSWEFSLKIQHCCKWYIFTWEIILIIQIWLNIPDS